MFCHKRRMTSVELRFEFVGEGWSLKGGFDGLGVKGVNVIYNLQIYNLQFIYDLVDLQFILKPET